MVNLDDVQDCRKAMRMLERRIHRAENGEGQDCDENRASRPPGRRAKHGGPHQPGSGGGSGRKEHVADLPLPQKLRRLQSRGMWKHLLRIARDVDAPRSLPELDEELDLPKNKMRSLKAIMAKLENRFDLQFLRVDHEAGEDASGNPRYVMLPRIRKQILRIDEQTAS